MGKEAHTMKRRAFSVHADAVPDIESDLYDDKEHTNAPSGFFSWSVLQVLLVHCFSGAFFGFGIGFVGPFYTFVKTSRECSRFVTEEACGSMHDAGCVWGGNACNYTFECSALPLAQCTAESKCLWEETTNVCEQFIGYSSVENGIFAASLIIGGCFGSMVAGPLLSVCGRKRSFLLCGIVACISSALTHWSTYNGIYVMVVAGRVVAGIASGVLCVASPMYVDEMLPDPHRQVVSVFFQVAVTFGMLLIASLALALDPQPTVGAVHIGLRRQMLCALSSVLSVLLVVVGLAMRESPRWLEDRARATNTEATPESTLTTASPTRKSEGSSVDAPLLTLPETEQAVSWRAMARPLLTAFIMCIAQQMTGINAIMSYAPNITSVMGLKPLVGNLVVMAWNFATVLVSIPLSSKFRADYTYIAAVFFSSASCLLTGISVFPAVGASEMVKRALSSTGIALFIAVFEIGMGAFFWTLSQSIFSSRFRSRGSSFTVLSQFLFNILINVGFPIAVEKLSGGPGGVKDKGMGIVFMFFGVVGFLAGAFLLKFLRSWDEGREKNRHACDSVSVSTH